MKVVGVDPGMHTGCVVWTDEKEGAAGLLEVHEFGGGEEEWNNAGLDALRPWHAERWREREYLCALSVFSVVQQWKPELLVCEDFVLRGGKNHSMARAGISPARIQAQLHTLMLLDVDVLLTMQVLWYQASVAKNVLTDERLKARDLWVPGKPHARDALRHALTGYKKVSGG